METKIIIFWSAWTFLFVAFFVFVHSLMQKRKKYHSQPAEYTPPKNINPLLAGYLIDGHFHIRDYVAGYIYLIQQKAIDANKQKPKKAVFTGLDLERAQVLIEKIAQEEGYVERGLSRFLSSLLYGILFLFVVLGFLVYAWQRSVFVGGHFPISTSIIFFLSLPLALYLAYTIVQLSKLKLSEKGREAKNALLGFKKFLSTTEADRLEYFNKPQTDSEAFMEYLPYAIALGVDNHWNMKYAGFISKMPSWYSPESLRLPVLPDGMNDITDVIYKVQEIQKKSGL